MVSGLAGAGHRGRVRAGERPLPRCLQIGVALVAVVVRGAGGEQLGERRAGPECAAGQVVGLREPGRVQPGRPEPAREVVQVAEQHPRLGAVGAGSPPGVDAHRLAELVDVGRGGSGVEVRRLDAAGSQPGGARGHALQEVSAEPRVVVGQTGGRQQARPPPGTSGWVRTGRCRGMPARRRRCGAGWRRRPSLRRRLAGRRCWPRTRSPAPPVVPRRPARPARRPGRGWGRRERCSPEAR